MYIQTRASVRAALTMLLPIYLMLSLMVEEVMAMPAGSWKEQVGRVDCVKGEQELQKVEKRQKMQEKANEEQEREMAMVNEGTGKLMMMLLGVQ